MTGLSTLATIISVLFFPLVFVALLYPHLAGSKGRWYGVCLYGTISIGMMLLAVVTSPDPQASNLEWTWLDWLVIAGGGMFFLIFLSKKYSSFKKPMLASKQLGKKWKHKGRGNHLTKSLKPKP